MLDAGDAEKDRTGCRLEELLTGSGGPCVRTAAPALHL